jgi:hypothetical protein
VWRRGAACSVSKKDATSLCGVSEQPATPRSTRVILDAPPLCARQPRVSNFRVCHTTPENRNSKDENGKAGLENGKPAAAVGARFSFAARELLRLERVM